MLIYQRAGKKRFMGLGSETVSGLAEARERAKQARQPIADGIDPIDQCAATRTMPAVRQLTFSECTEGYIAAPRGRVEERR